MIDLELAEFLARGNSIVVATRSASLAPRATRASGLRVVGPDRIEVLLPRATSSTDLENLRDNGAIALCVSSPSTYRTVQLKGRSLGIADASDDEVDLTERQFREFQTAVGAYGVSRQRARNLWLFDCWRIDVLITAAFAQTPGPGAGAPLADRDGAPRT